MTLKQWENAFDLNVPAMDNEHRGLIAAMNEVHSLHEKGAGRAQVKAALKRLGQLTTEHFEHEERFMDSIQFPRLAIHKSIHKMLLQQFAEHVQRFENGGELNRAFFAFLKNWLAAHICGVDRKYAKHSRGEAA